MKHKKKLYLILSLALITVAISGFTLWQHRIELFVIPQKWEKICKLREEVSEENLKEIELRIENSEILAKEIYELVQLQKKPELPQDCKISLVPFRGIDQKNLFCLLYSNESRHFEPSKTKGPTYQHPPHWDQGNVIVFNSNGIILGKPFNFQLTNSSTWTVYSPKKHFFEVITNDDFLSFSIDSEGAVPLGFANLKFEDKLKGKLTQLIPQYIENNEDIKLWIADAKSNQAEYILDSSFFSENAALRFLESRTIGDQHRGLFRLELLGKSVAHHAFKLTESNDDFLRARASVIAASDPSSAKKLVSKLEADPCQYLKEALSLALVHSEDEEVAQKALVYALDMNIDEVFWINLPIRKLASPEVAGAILRKIKNKLIERNEISHLVPYLLAMNHSDLTPHIKSLHELWDRVVDVYSYKALRNALAWCLGHQNDDHSLKIILKNLDSSTIVSDITLEALTNSQHDHQKLISRLSKISRAEEDSYLGFLATNALALRGDQESIDLLKKNLVDPQLIWIDLSVSEQYYFEYTQYENEDVLIPNNLEFDLTVRSPPHPFSINVPKEILSFIVQSALSNVKDLEMEFIEIITDIPSSKTRQIIEKQIRLRLSQQSTPNIREGFIDFLIGRRAEWANQQVLNILNSDSANPNLIAIVLMDYLLFPWHKPTPMMVDYLLKLAHPSHSGTSPLKLNAQLNVDSPIVIYEEVFNNIPLAASLILCRWGVEGETGKLFKKIKQPTNNWIQSELFEQYSPKSFEPYLKQLIELNPTKFKERCEEILSWGRASNWSTP